MSYPAAKALPRVGVLAAFESFFIRRGGRFAGICVVAPTMGWVWDAIVAVGSVLGRLGSGELEREGGSWGGGVLGIPSVWRFGN